MTKKRNKHNEWPNNTTSINYKVSDVRIIHEHGSDERRSNVYTTFNSNAQFVYEIWLFAVSPSG